MKFGLIAFVDPGTMSNLDDNDDNIGVLDLINYPVNALPNAVTVLAGQFDTAFTPWVYRQGVYSLQYFSYIPFRDSAKIFGN